MSKLTDFSKIIMRFPYLKSDNHSYKLLAKQANFMYTEILFLRSQITTKQQKKNYHEWNKNIHSSMKIDDIPNHTTHG